MAQKKKSFLAIFTSHLCRFYVLKIEAISVHPAFAFSVITWNYEWKESKQYKSIPHGLNKTLSNILFKKLSESIYRANWSEGPNRDPFGPKEEDNPLLLGWG